MCMNLTKKDIISINKNFALGHFENESSLNFALEHSKYEIAWTKQLAYLIRAVLIDHVFVDGNKRTAYGLLLNYVSLNKWSIEEKQATELIKSLVLKKEKSVTNIQRRIKSEFLKNFEKILKEKPSGFKALEEFEKTGRTIIKTRLNFTIDRELAREFRDYCRKQKLNMSAEIEELIKKRISS